MKILISVLMSLSLSLTLISAEAQMIREGKQLPLMVDLQKTQQMAKKKNVPIVVFVTASWCHYCEILKHNVLNPIIEHTDILQYAEFRELIVDAKRWNLTDFNGERINMPIIAKRYKASFTPTTLFLSPDGKELSRRIVGLTLEEFYPHNLEVGIKESLKKLGNPNRDFDIVNSPE